MKGDLTPNLSKTQLNLYRSRKIPPKIMIKKLKLS